MDKIEWPSERVSHGGIFHQRSVNYSKETHNMIKSEKSFGIFGSFSCSFPAHAFFPFFLSSADERGPIDDAPTQQDQLLPARRFGTAAARNADT